MSPRAPLVVAAVLGAALSITARLPQTSHEISQVYYSDFGRFYYSTHQFLQGRPMYVPVPEHLRARGEELRQRTDLTPPHAHLLFVPVAWLPLPAALVVWVAINGLAICWCARLTVQELQVTPDRQTLVLAVAVGLASAPFAAWMITGQVSFVYTVPLLLAWRAHRRGAMGPAGAWMGLLWSAKPFLGVFALYFAWRREWRAVAAASFSTALAFAVGLAIFGVDAHIGWLHDLSAVTWVAHPRNASLLGLTATLFGSSSIGRVVWIALAALTTVGGVAIVVCSRSVDQQWLALLAAALLLSPLGWVYYWCWLVVPAVAVWVIAPPATHRQRVFLFLGFITAWWPWELGQPAYTFGLSLVLVSLVPLQTLGIVTRSRQVSSVDACAVPSRQRQRLPPLPQR